VQLLLVYFTPSPTPPPLHPPQHPSLWSLAVCLYAFFLLLFSADTDAAAVTVPGWLSGGVDVVGDWCTRLKRLHSYSSIEELSQQDPDLAVRALDL